MPEKTVYGGTATKSWPVANGCCEALPCSQRCWAKRTVNRLAHSPNAQVRAAHEDLVTSRRLLKPNGFPDLAWAGITRLNEPHLADPLHWRAPQRVAVAYHGDLFRLPTEQIDRVFAVMALCPQHTFLVLTKAAREMREYATDTATHGFGLGHDVIIRIASHLNKAPAEIRRNWPLPNVWLGVSCEDQPAADERIPQLLQIPAAVRWISIEPMIGPVDLSRYMWPTHWSWDAKYRSPKEALAAGAYAERKPQALLSCEAADRLLGRRNGWVALGGESGPKARPMYPDWARSIRDQCAAAGVKFLFKQWGEWEPQCQASGNTGFGSEMYHWEAPYDAGDCRVSFRVGKRAAGRLLDGREHLEMPDPRGQGEVEPC